MSIPQEGAVSPQEDAGSSNVRVTFVSRLLGGVRFWTRGAFDSGHYPRSILGSTPFRFWSSLLSVTRSYL